MSSVTAKNKEGRQEEAMRYVLHVRAETLISFAGATAAGLPTEYTMRSTRGDVSGLHVFAEEPDFISKSFFFFKGSHSLICQAQCSLALYRPSISLLHGEFSWLSPQSLTPSSEWAARNSKLCLTKVRKGEGNPKLPPTYHWRQRCNVWGQHGLQA